MGQAKARKQEILQLKANSAKDAKKLINFGTYYRDDQDDGVSISFGIYNEPLPGFTQTMYENVTLCGNHMITDIRNGKDTVESIFSQLITAIKDFNIEVFGSEVRPRNKTYEINLVKDCEPNTNLIALMSVIMSDIYVLTELGYIKNDNYNGLHFVHMS